MVTYPLVSTIPGYSRLKIVAPQPECQGKTDVQCFLAVLSLVLSELSNAHRYELEVFSTRSLFFPIRKPGVSQEFFEV